VRLTTFPNTDVFPQDRVEILYPEDYLPTENLAQTHLIKSFVAGVESAFSVKKTKISLAALWKEQLPDGPEHGDIGTYLQIVCHQPVRYA
jgi:hypothetical protein